MKTILKNYIGHVESPNPHGTVSYLEPVFEGQEGGYTHPAPAAAAPEAPVAPAVEEVPTAPAPTPAPKPDVSAGDNLSTEEVDKW